MFSGLASLPVSTASAQNGTWEAYPGQSATYEAAVQQPINADGSSNFRANGRAVIPVKFALSQGLGAFVFKSISSDNPGVTDNDFSYLSFTPNTPVTFNEITELPSMRSHRVTAMAERSGGQSAQAQLNPSSSTMVIILISQIARRTPKAV